MAPADPILGVAVAYKKDPAPTKVRSYTSVCTCLSTEGLYTCGVRLAQKLLSIVRGQSQREHAHADAHAHTHQIQEDQQTTSTNIKTLLPGRMYVNTM